ncbi:MAG: hypothetical protein REI11_17915, partial [Patulibacter sp.]|nr:hypothetical protein [Patulibacter sp.]
LVGVPTLAVTISGGALAIVHGASAATPALTLSTDLATVPQPPEPTAANPVAAVEATTAKDFAAFSTAPVSPIPAAVAAAVASPQRYGRNPNLARAVNTVYGKGWVVPGRGYVCLVVPDPNAEYTTSCLPTDVAAKNGLQISVGGFDAAGRIAVTTVAPTGRTVVSRTANTAVAKVSTAAPGIASVANTASDADGVASELVTPDTVVGLDG